MADTPAVRAVLLDLDGTLLAGYMLRAPLSLAKMSYDAPSGTVICRRRAHRRAGRGPIGLIPP
jgi:hypothetical protein